MDRKLLKKIVVSIIAGITSLALATQINRREELIEAQRLQPVPVLAEVQRLDDDQDDEEEVGEKEEAKESVFIRLLRALKIVLLLPFVVMIGILITAVRVLTMFIRIPFLLFLARWILIFLLLLLLVIAIAKILFPKVPLKKILNWKNLLVLALVSLGLSFVDTEELWKDLINTMKKKE